MTNVTNIAEVAKPAPPSPIPSVWAITYQLDDMTYATAEVEGYIGYFSHLFVAVYTMFPFEGNYPVFMCHSDNVVTIVDLKSDVVIELDAVPTEKNLNS